ARSCRAMVRALSFFLLSIMAAWWGPQQQRSSTLKRKVCAPLALAAVSLVQDNGGVIRPGGNHGQFQQTRAIPEQRWLVVCAAVPVPVAGNAGGGGTRRMFRRLGVLRGPRLRLRTGTGARRPGKRVERRPGRSLLLPGRRLSAGP